MLLYHTVVQLLLAVLVSKVLCSPLDSRISANQITNSFAQEDKEEYANMTLYPRDTPCDPIAMYTIQWFLDNVNYEPPQSTCLFYGGVPKQGNPARKYASNRGLTTIWDIWPKRQYRWNLKPGQPDPFNPMRCIFDSDDARGKYFTAMSTAMAALCQGYAQFMTPNPNRIPDEGLFRSDEFPEMRRNTYKTQFQVDEVAAIPTDGGTPVTLWRRATDRIDPWPRREVHNNSETALPDIYRRATNNADKADAGAEDVFDICGLYPVVW